MSDAHQFPVCAGYQKSVGLDVTPLGLTVESSSASCLLSLSTGAVSLAIVSLSFAVSGAVGAAVGDDAGIAFGGLEGSGDNADGGIDVPKITHHNTNTSAAARITFIKPSMASPIVHAAG